MRGDRPRQYIRRCPGDTATPHARGSTLIKETPATAKGGYPACAGIDLITLVIIATTYWLPRMRGDRP